MVFERIDFANDGWLGEDWTVSVPAGKDAAFSFDSRAAAKASRFADLSCTPPVHLHFIWPLNSRAASAGVLV